MPSRLRTFAGTTLFVLALAAPAAAQEAPWVAPAVGLSVTFDVGVQNTVVAVEDKVVVVDGTADGEMQRSRLYRGLHNMEMAGAPLQVDTAAADTLWPLAPGKTATVTISGSMFTGQQVVTVAGFEELELPFGKVSTAVLDIASTMQASGLSLSINQRMWYATELGVDVQNYLEFTVNGEARPPIAMTATAIEQP